MNAFGKPVNNNQDNRVTLIFRQSKDKIQGEVFPRPVRYWKRTEEACRAPSFVFGRLAIKAIGHESSDVSTEASPIEVLGNSSKGLGNARVAPYGSSMILMEECGDDRNIPR